MQVTIEPVTAANWRATLDLGVYPEQQRFVAGYAPISAIALAKAYVRAGGNTWSPLLLRSDGEPAGFAAIATKPSAPGVSWVFHFFIDKDWQGAGLGRAAMHALIAHMRDLPGPVTRLMLTVHPENTPAQHLYHSIGFGPTVEEIDNEPVYTLAV